MLNRLLLTTFALLAGTAASAHPEPHEVEVQFRYAATDLRTAESRAALRERLHRFARRECYGGSVYTVIAERECRREIERQIVRKIGDKRLAEATGIDLNDRPSASIASLRPQ